VLNPQIPIQLARKLHWLSYLFEEEEENETREEVLEAISDFQDQIALLEKRSYRFPLLVDDYVANYMIGQEEDGDIPEDLSELSIESDPAQIQSYLYHKYGYVESITQTNLKHDWYYSTNDATWIILSGTLIEFSILEHLINVYRNYVFKPLELQEASVLVTDNLDTIVFNQVEAVKYPFNQITNAQECVTDIYQLKKNRTIDKLSATKFKQNLLSSNGDVLIVIDQMAQYIFFRDNLTTVSEETLISLSKRLPTLNAYLDNLQDNRGKRREKLIAYNKKIVYEP